MTKFAACGNEDLSELRFGITLGSRQWLRLQAVQGLEQFSPRTGFIVTAGVLR